MNRFLTKKKAKKPPQPKLEIDLASALPPSDDFRTSLLMTGLSARFSMLREQDDPSTKIGKASDDSVLFPKRQSRLDFSAMRGLADISETDMTPASIRPFARMDSYHSADDDSTHASTMARSRPNEGNVLFGGRQKIYKIPVGCSKGEGGGWGSRALYDDDVSMSAFQVWKREEKDRKSLEAVDGELVSERPSTEDADTSRPESPFFGHDRKRETSSTISSGPSVGRHSTAGTSITSQKCASSGKDSQPTRTGSDRSSMRTRRLYETGLKHELQEQQSSALSRMDTLSRRQKTSPSPTSAVSSERWLPSNASAPNLSSLGSGAMPSISATTDGRGRAAGSGDARGGLSIIPPLSPPISEAEEFSPLPIEAKDRGKATSLGVFQRPSQPYDESRYAQRQVQLQQGRETPTRNSGATQATDRSVSSSSTRGPAYSEPGLESAFKQAESPRGDETRPGNIRAEDADISPVRHDGAGQSRDVSQCRVNDEHPWRSANDVRPTAVSVTVSGVAQNGADSSSPTAALDSPTLGPTSGLSGMVRQHLRSISGASSVCDAAPSTGDYERFPPELQQLVGQAITGFDVSNQNRGESHSQLESSEQPKRTEDGRNRRPSRSSGADHAAGPPDEFASRLADGARRIRERLTSYVDIECSPTGSPSSPSYSQRRDAMPRPNGLGILKPSASRGALVDRDQNRPAHQRVGTGGQDGPGTLPAAGQQQPSEMADVGPVQKQGPEDVRPEAVYSETNSPRADVPAGLLAFRQATRELQMVKEREAQNIARNMSPPHGPPPVIPVHDPRMGSRQSTPSRERGPPPVQYRQRAPSVADSHFGGDSRPSSRADRDRSGSESNGSRSGSRPPPRAPNAFIGRGQPIGPGHGKGQMQGPGQAGPNGPSRLMMRSSPVSGNDVRQHPTNSPPWAYPATAPGWDHAPASYNKYGGMHVVHTHAREHDLRHPSSRSPVASPAEAWGPSAYADGHGSRRPSISVLPLNSDGTEVPGLSDVLKRLIKKNDISQPSFVMSTSSVPTVSLPAQAATTRSRSNSRSRSGSKSDYYGNAPPVPHINPRRQHEGSRSRMGLGAHVGNKSSVQIEAASSTPTLSRGCASTAEMGDIDGQMHQHRFRQHGDTQGPYGRPPIPTQQSIPPHQSTPPHRGASALRSIGNFKTVRDVPPGGMI